MALSRQRKQRLKRRARTETRREAAPTMGAARGQIKQANREYGREVSDARGAQKTMTSQLSQMLAGLGSKGLKGKYAAQTAADLRSRKADAVSGLPYAVSQAQDRRADAVSGAQSSLAQTRAEAQSAAGTRLNDLLSAARENKSERVETRQAAKQEQADTNKGLRAAMIAAKAGWNGATGEVIDGEQMPGKENIVANPDAFAVEVAKNKGVTVEDARKATERLVRGYQKQTARGAFENVHGPQDWNKKRKKRRGR